MKARLEETPDAAGKAELLREKLMPEDALRRGKDYLPTRLLPMRSIPKTFA